MRKFFEIFEVVGCGVVKMSFVPLLVVVDDDDGLIYSGEGAIYICARSMGTDITTFPFSFVR